MLESGTCDLMTHASRKMSKFMSTKSELQPDHISSLYLMLTFNVHVDVAQGALIDVDREFHRYRKRAFQSKPII